MKRILRYFLRGLLVFVPAGLTIFIIAYVFTNLDKLFRDLFKLNIPGLGLLVTIAGIFLIGLFTSNFVGRKFFAFLESILTRVPVVKMLYSSIKDLVEAFAGEKKKFDTPVLATLGPGSNAKVIGFVTRKSLGTLGLEDHVAVYLPQSYNFAGNVLLFPKELVQPLDIESSKAMAFIVSGGVAGD